MLYADVLLPLPLSGTYTYSVPPEIVQIQKGSRVYVQFGKRKFYTGIVTSVHTNTPSYPVKEITTLLDPKPILKYPQLKFWEWIAEYYLCTQGEVMRAALPSGLKIGSETTVTLAPDQDPSQWEELDSKDIQLLQLISHTGPSPISELENKSEIKAISSRLSRLIEKGLLIIGERSTSKYKPKTITYVEICCQRTDNESLHRYFDITNRSAKQQRMLVGYLELSDWTNTNKKVKEVTKESLLQLTQESPAILKALIDKKILKLVKKKSNRFDLKGDNVSATLAPLSPSQQEAMHSVTNGFRTNNTILLHGVTGSGKTEIYSHIARAVLDSGRSVLYLVPEISLTAQLTDRLKRYFPSEIIVYHSKFSDNERVDIWQKLLDSTKPSLILGVRSSVFLPFCNLGLVIIDEEHEPSFKQYDPAPRYNARDAAIMLARMHGAKTLLGSATPSIETYYKALSGKYGLVSLLQRYKGAELPKVEIVDMRQQRQQRLNNGMLSLPLAESLKQSLENKRQIIVFQNRRGYAPVVVCGQCGWTPKCPNCDVSPIYHRNTSDLRCHYCGTVATLPSLCPACGQNSIEIFGYGTERIADDLHRIYADARVSRLDTDTTRNRDSYHEIIDEFAKGDTDILVGTQMVTKGLDFDRVTTVGIINADTILNFPDFRSNERAFNMLEQVAGRAGRKKDKGEVIVQTTNPSNPILAKVQQHDYKGYYITELAQRKLFNYPPYSKIININLRHRNLAHLEEITRAYGNALKSIFGQRTFGPEKPFVSRIANQHIRVFMLKIETAASMKKVKEILQNIYEKLSEDPKTKGLTLYYDVDPV